jgi:hypothetical protein
MRAECRVNLDRESFPPHRLVRHAQERISAEVRLLDAAVLHRDLQNDQESVIRPQFGDR